LCLVCGEKAGKHSYYGGQVCLSCRAFFRRSVFSGYNNSYICAKQSKCEIRLKTRKSCQFCRYQKCCEAGMKASWVITEDEMREKMRQDNTSSLSPPDDSEDRCKKPAQIAQLSPAELQVIDSLVEETGFFHPNKSEDLDIHLARQIVRLVAFHAPLDYLSQYQLKEVFLRRAKIFANKFAELDKLTLSDKIKLMMHNVGSVSQLHLCSMLTPDLVWLHQLSPLMGDCEVGKLNSKLIDLSVTGLENLHLSIKFFFPDIKESESSLILSVANYLADADEREMTLVCLIMLLSSDNLDVTESRQIERWQVKYATMLHRYLRTKHANKTDLSRLRLASAMSVMSKCRELSMMACPS